MLGAALAVGCNRGRAPDRHGDPGVTPAKAVAAGPKAELSTIVKVSGQVVREARIATAPAERRRLSATVELTGQVVPDPDAIAILSARVAGRILTVLAREGDHVRAGMVIAIVSSPELARLRSDYGA